MNIKLKKQYINTEIYVPFENRNILGKFIDARLYVYMYKKYPDFFDLTCDRCLETKCKCKKNKQTDDIYINNAKSKSGSDFIGEGK